MRKTSTVHSNTLEIKNSPLRKKRRDPQQDKKIKLNKEESNYKLSPNKPGSGVLYSGL